jgi:hypothetical protein
MMQWQYHNGNLDAGEKIVMIRRLMVKEVIKMLINKDANKGTARYDKDW